MKSSHLIGALVVVVMLGAAIWWFGFRGSVEKITPGESSRQFSETQKKGKQDPSGDKTRPASPVTGPALGSRPKIIDSLPEKYGDFSAEIGLTEAKFDELLAILRESHQKRIALSRGPSVEGGQPTISSSSDLMELKKEREGRLESALGKSGYEKFKAFNSTYKARSVISDLGENLLGDDKQAVLYRAYEDVSSMGPASSELEFSNRLTAAIVKRSEEHLSESELATLKSALDEQYVESIRARDRRFRVPGERPPVPSTPGTPAGL